MCLSFVGQFLFGILTVIVLGLTVMSMFSPGLEELGKIAENITEDLKHFTIPQGFNILETLCRLPSINNITVSETDSVNYCKNWFHELEDWEKIAIVFMCSAVVVEVITLCWTIITCCGCCRKMCLQLSAILSLIVALFLAVAFTIFVVNNQKIIDSIRNLTENFELKIYDEIESRFYWAFAALVLAIINFFIACLNICCVKCCC